MWPSLFREISMKALFSFACLALVLAFGQSGTAIAQDAPEISKTYCEDNDGFSEWDFWVGEWTVYANDEARTRVGTNSITKHYANCLIKETWVDINGNGGFSVNYYNPVRSQWRQVWVSNGYSIDYTGGLNEEGQMVLEGEIDNYQPNNSQRFRGTWTAQENGDVIQRFEAHDAETDKWTVWFEGRYVRKENEAE
jgi:hypothetical protein